tara:strand:- start:3294 stop:3710 length:417 start_codon:yes stop_codon:yes gene_type:complete
MQDESIAITGGGYWLANRHFSGVKQVTPPRRSVPNHSGSRTNRKVGKRITFRSTMHSVIPEHKHIVRTLSFTIFIKERPKQRSIVSAQCKKSYLPLLTKAFEGINKTKTRPFIPHAEQQNVEVVETCSPESDFYRGTN